MASWSRRPGVILGALTALNGLNYLDRYVAAATLPLILTGLGISDAQGGLLQSLFIVSYSLVCPLAGWLGDRQPRLRLAAIGVFVWSVATVASGLAPTYALAAAGARGHRRRRGQLCRRHALAALGLLRGRAACARVLGHLLRGDPGRAARSATSSAAWSARRTAGGRRSSSPGRRAPCWPSCCCCLTEPRRGAMEPPGAAAPAVARRSRLAAASSARRRSYLVNTVGPDHLHVRHGRPGDVDADLLRAGARHPAGDRLGDLRPAPGGRRIRRHAARRSHRRSGGPAPARAPTSPCRAGRWSPRSCSRCRPCWRRSPGLLARDVRDAAPALRQHRARSTPPWPTCCRPSCGRAASPSRRC